MTSGSKAQTGNKGTTSVTLAGDVTGPSSANTVVKINGSPLGTTTGATSGQYLAWNGSAWVPTTAAAGGVTSFNTRTGAVVPANADYLSVATGGLTGATSPTRFVGGTANGAPTTGTFSVGDFIVDETASLWVCTIAGTPGTWSTTISNHVTLRSATATAKYNEITLFQGSTAGQTISAVSSPLDSTTWTIINNSSVTVTAGFSSNAMYPLGSGSTVTSLTIPINAAYSFVNYNGGNWYMISSNNASNLQGVLSTTNGGTGLSTIGTAGQVLTVNSGATGLQYSTPTTTTSVTMGGDVTGNSATSTVANINGSPLGTTTGATTGNVLTWNGSAWAPAAAGASLNHFQGYLTSDFSLSAGSGTTNTIFTTSSLATGYWLVNFYLMFYTAGGLSGNAGVQVNPSGQAGSATITNLGPNVSWNFVNGGNYSYQPYSISTLINVTNAGSITLCCTTNMSPNCYAKGSQTYNGYTNQYGTGYSIIKIA